MREEGSKRETVIERKNERMGKRKRKHDKKREGESPVVVEGEKEGGGVS